MKKQICLLVAILFALGLQAQCYEPNVKRADSAYFNGQYQKAMTLYQTALKCPDANLFSDGKTAKEGVARCREMMDVSDFQCYESKIREADVAYGKGLYNEARDCYKKALTCSDAANYNNGQLAKDGIKKCEKQIMEKAKNDAIEKSREVARDAAR